MSQQKVSQAECSDDLLSSEQLHSLECAQVDEPLSEEERAMLIERMRAGDAQAKEALFFSMMRYVRMVAWDMSFRYRWIMRRDERLDLLQIGYEAMLEKWDEAFATKEHPVSFLFAWAKFAIRKYCISFQTAIITPNDGLSEAYQVGSLDIALSTDGGESDETLADILSETIPLPPSRYASEEMSERLHATVQRLLTPKQVHVLACLFGLWEHAPQGICELAESEGVDSSTVCQRRDGALKRLRKLLQVPDATAEMYTREQARKRLGVSGFRFRMLISEGVIPASKWGMYPKQLIDSLAEQGQVFVSVSDQKQERVRAACAELAQRGEPVTVAAVARLAGVGWPVARAYVRHFQASVMVSA